MSWMIEVYLGRSVSGLTEQGALAIAMTQGGLCTYRESEPEQIVLTIEFTREVDADLASNALRSSNYHVEGPGEY